MEVGANLSTEGVILHNLKAAMYKMSVETLPAHVTAMASHGNLVFVGIANRGIQIFRLDGSEIKEDITLPYSTKSVRNTCSCYEIQASPDNLVYIKEENGQSMLCVHSMSNVLEGKTQIETSAELTRRAPLTMEPQLKLIILESEESHLRVLSLNTLSVLKDWQAVDNSISLLRSQMTSEHSLLGVSDSQSGLKVYDMRQPTASDYVCLYQIPVDEIRNFRLAGDFVAVFHKFEANVTFWNMKEHRTILCINIQDQMRHLAEEFLDDDEEDDVGLFGDDDDHVTAVTDIPSDDDNVLVYGTKSGCIFGISVNNRRKLFNIPCPHEGVLETPPLKRDIQAITFVGSGRLVVCYANFGFTVLDFSPVNPPDRPPTRSQRRSEGEAK